MAGKTKEPSEHYEQTMYFIELRSMFRHWPELGLAYAIPNGGQRHKAVAKKLKDEGVKPGVPDIFIPIPRGQYNGMYIEMKREKGGRLTADQKIMIPALQAQGYRVEVCRGYKEAVSKTIEYMDLGGFKI